MDKHKQQGFKVAEGWFLLRPVSLKGSAKGGDADTIEAFRWLRGLRQTAYYTVEKAGVSTPLGYFITSEAKPKLDAAFEEIRNAAEIPNLFGTKGKGFSLQVGGYASRVDTSSDNTCGAMRDFLLLRIRQVRDRVVQGSKAYVYTQDDVSRLWTLCGDPDMADNVRRALEAAKADGSTLLLDDVIRKLEEARNNELSGHSGKIAGHEKDGVTSRGRKRLIPV